MKAGSPLNPLLVLTHFDRWHGVRRSVKLGGGHQASEGDSDLLKQQFA